MTQITKEQFDDFLTGVKTSFSGAFDNTDTTYGEIATTIPSSGRQNTYKWLGQIPNMREWIGDRVLNEVGKHSYTIENRKFENTIRVSIDDLADGEVGQYAILAKGLGDEARNFPEALVYETLVSGFTELCFDGQNFFDVDHPVMVNGEEESASNMQAGAGEAWFLLDTTKIVKPIIFQDRLKPEFKSLDTDANTMVFMKDEYAFGTKMRCNAGYGFWQTAFGSKAEPTSANLEAAKVKMRSLKNDNGKSLNVKPNVVVCGPSLESYFIKLRDADKIGNEHNVHKGTFTLVVSGYVE